MGQPAPVTFIMLLQAEGERQPPKAHRREKIVRSPFLFLPLTVDVILERLLQGPMNSERQKREREIERLVQGTKVTREADSAFQEEVRKAAAAMFEQETSRIQKSERPERPHKRSINLATAGLWLLVLGVAAIVFSLSGAGAMLIVCGIAAMVWGTFLKSSKNKPSRTQHRGAAPSRPSSGDKIS
jgi:Flp pilus assembly protein TadB